MSTHANENLYNLRQGTRTGPEYLAAFERAYKAVHPPPSADDAQARLFYGAHENVQKAIMKDFDFGDGAELVDGTTLEQIKEAIRNTPNPAHHPPQHAHVAPPAAAPQPAYYYADTGTSVFHGTTGPVGTINPGGWQQ